MYTLNPMEIDFPVSAKALSYKLGATLVGDPDQMIERLASLAQSEPGTLAFCQQKNSTNGLPQLKGGVLITKRECVEEALPLTYLVVENPKEAFARVASTFSTYPKQRGISELAVISSQATLGAEVTVGPGAIIEAGAQIGARTKILAGVFIGENTVVGEDTWIFPHAVLFSGITIGSRVKIGANSVLGSDGFGYLPGPEGLKEVPQLGTVVVEDDVRIGALNTIDRATLGETRIKRGAKLDNLVHVGHNATIGEHSVLCAQVGIAGSAVIGRGVLLGGQAGVNDHTTVGDFAQVGGQAGVIQSIDGGGKYWGTPAIPLQEHLRQRGMVRRLSKIWKNLSGAQKTMGGDK